MATTIRTTITFTAPQFVYLQAEAARLDISVSDVVRRIIDHYRDNQTTQTEPRT